MKTIIVKYAQDYVWNFYFNEDPKLGVHIGYTAYYSTAGRRCNIKLFYEAHEQDQAKRDLEALHKINPDDAYALCPLIEEGYYSKLKF